MNFPAFFTILAALLVARVLQPVADRIAGALWGGRTIAAGPRAGSATGGGSSPSIGRADGIGPTDGDG